MKAVVKTKKGIGNIEVLDMPEPKVGPGQVKIRVRAAGICGTDLHIYYDEFPNRPPVILGHEFSGVVAEVGEGVNWLSPGDRVVAQTSAVTCGRCRYCLTGSIAMCRERRGIGFGVNGAFTKYIVVPHQIVHKIPEEVDDLSAAMTEPASVAVHSAIERVPVAAGDTVLVSGVGTIGLLILQVAKAQGATVLVAGTSQDKARLELARSLGADHIINVNAQDVVNVALDLTGGEGVDIAFECAGAPQSYNACLKALRRQGALGMVGLYGKTFDAENELIPMKELQVIGIYGHIWVTWGRALSLMAKGMIKTRPLISAVLPITRWEEGFRQLEAKEGVKYLLQPVD